MPLSKFSSAASGNISYVPAARQQALAHARRVQARLVLPPDLLGQAPPLLEVGVDLGPMVQVVGNCLSGV
jgi:hypothetical protein